MHRNTMIFIIVLALVAVLLVGINIGRTIPKETILTVAPSPTTAANSSAETAIVKDCGVSFTYDAPYEFKTGSQSASLTNKATNDTIRIGCIEEIPKPPLPPEKIEETTIAGVKTKLYHDASAKDGTPVDAVIVKHPKRDLEVGFFGFGGAFNKLLPTITFD